VILLHGYAETSRMWRPIMPSWRTLYRDRPAYPESATPPSRKRLDMKTSAMRIHALARSLGVEKARVVDTTSDDGRLRLCRAVPCRTEKLVVMDAFLPGVEGWEAVYNNPAIWHFRFNGPTPEQLVQGRERIYFEHFWNNFAADKTRSIPEAERKPTPRPMRDREE